MATANPAPLLATTLPSEIDLAAQRRQAWMILFAYAIFVLGGPFVSFADVSNVELRGQGGGAHIHLHALAYGIPLLAAFFGSNRFRGFRITFVGSNWLDPLAALMFVYWFLQGIHGFSTGNGIRPVISNGFAFSVPMLCYFAMRNLDYPGVPRLLARNFVRICMLSILPNLFMTFYAVSVMGFVGAGGVSHILPVAAATVALMTGRNLLATLALVGSLATILASLKRAVWGGVFIFPVVYLWTIQRTQHIFKFAIAGVVLFSLLLAFEEYLPTRLRVAGLTSRIESIYLETQGFSSGQARQDEIVGIWEETVTKGTWMNVLFGRGIGASYTYYTATTYRRVIYEYRNSHFTPTAWLLRGGFVGMLLNITFYAVAAASAVAATRQAAPEDQIWLGALTAYFIVAVALSVTAFSLTPNAATHLGLMAVLVHNAGTRREAAFGEASI